jgi:hypothetical protein
MGYPFNGSLPSPVADPIEDGAPVVICHSTATWYPYGRGSRAYHMTITTR